MLLGLFLIELDWIGLYVDCVGWIVVYWVRLGLVDLDFNLVGLCCIGLN